MKFWGRARGPDGRAAYAELYRDLAGRDAVSIHVENPDGYWSVVRLLRSDFEALLSAYRVRCRDNLD
jgi:hypothetical protein